MGAKKYSIVLQKYLFRRRDVVWGTWEQKGRHDHWQLKRLMFMTSMNRLALIILLFISIRTNRKQVWFGLALLFFHPYGKIILGLVNICVLSLRDSFNIILIYFFIFFLRDVIMFSSLIRLKSSWVLFWLDQLFLFPGLVCMEQGFAYGWDH